MSTPLASTSQALVNALRDRLEETVSVAALDDRDRQRIIYIARAEKNQVIAAPLMVGSMLPAHCTSMGRVLLAALPPSARAAWVAGCKPAPRPDRTLPNTAALTDALELVPRPKWFLFDGDTPPCL